VAEVTVSRADVGDGELELSACAMCGLRFDPAEHTGCASCPVQSGCSLACCPACGYSFVDPERSSVVRLGARLTSRFRRRAASESGQSTLGDVARGHSARVADLEGLPLRPREQLQAYGLAPGRLVEVLQTKPVTVVRVEHVDIAFESSLARGIRVEHADA